MIMYILIRGEVFIENLVDFYFIRNFNRWVFWVLMLQQMGSNNLEREKGQSGYMIISKIEYSIIVEEEIKKIGKKRYKN